MRIVVRCSDVRAARRGQEALAAARMEAAALAGSIASLRAAPDGEDVLVVSAIDSGLEAAAAYATASLAFAPRPLCVLAGLAAKAPPPMGLAEHAVFTGAVALDAPPALLGAQVRAAARAGVAIEERVRRLATSLALGAAAPKTPEPRKLRALYIGAPCPLFLSLEAAFAHHGGLVAAAFTSYCGFDHLHDEEFDAVVLNGAADAQTAISLCAALRRNASLHHLPTLVITAPGDGATAKASIERGAAAIVGMDEASAPALGWLFEAIRCERRRRRAEHDLRDLADVMGEPRTGLMRADAFSAHLERLAQDHHQSGRRLALAALRVLPAPGARAPAQAPWRRAMAEASSLAARLVRDADSAAAIGADIIAVALPAAGLGAARRTAERIASVAECSAFAAGEGDAGPLVFEQSAVELAPGESGRGLLARACTVYALESVPA